MNRAEQTDPHALADLIEHERDYAKDHGFLRSTLWLSYEDATMIAAALRSTPEAGDQGAEAMRTELRPFAEGEGEGLDEVVIHGSHIVHAETMSDTALWIGIHDQAGGLVHIWVNAVRRKGKLGIVMTATDEGERGTISQGTALPTPQPQSHTEEERT